MNSILALGSKALSMAISLVCGVLTTRLILGEADVPSYALYSLLVGLPAMLSFTDLGSGAVVVNAIATSDGPRRDPRVVASLTSVGRILVGFSVATMVINMVLLLSGAWTALLGDAGSLRNADLAAFSCLSVFCVGVPVGIWVRIQLGLRRNHVIILLQALISPMNLLLVWVILQMPQGSGHSYVALGSFVSSLLVSVIGFSLTARGTHPLVLNAVRRVFRFREFPSVQVMHVGWPMLAQLISSPIAFASQRYILAQSGSQHDVAEYGVAAQVFFALNGLVMAAGVALWPQYANRRHRGELRRGPFLLSFAFAAGIATATALVVVFAPWIFPFITSGRVVVSLATLLSFGMMMTLQAAIYPMGMFIMDEPGIRFQVAPALLMAAATVALAVPLTPLLGTIGPLLANSISIFVFQLIPFYIYINRNRDRLLSAG